MKKIKNILAVLFILIPYFLFSQNLVYKPINPFFGGDTFNYQQLLASASAQNSFEEGGDNEIEEKSDLDNFTDSLNRQLLNSLSRDLYTEQIGSQALTVGTYVFGSLVVEISPTGNGLMVNILDTITGEQTQITIPN